MDPAVDAMQLTILSFQVFPDDLAVDSVQAYGSDVQIFGVDPVVCVGNIQSVHGWRKGEGKSAVPAGNSQPAEQGEGFFFEKQGISLCVHLKPFGEVLSVIVTDDVLDVSALDPHGSSEQTDVEFCDRLSL